MIAALVVLLVVVPTATGAGADQHMLAGAQFFRDQKYPEALVEFRAAEKSPAGDPGTAWYVAATLVKLNRADDALVEFARAEAAAPHDRDGLLSFYQALACYQARLYLCADRLLASLGSAPGPRIADQARKIRGDLSPLLRQPPSHEALDWYHDRGQAALDARRPALAAAYFDEAVGLAALRPDRYRESEAEAAAARARRMIARAAGRQP